MTNAYDTTKAALEKLTANDQELNGQVYWYNPDYEADHEASRKATLTSERIDGLVHDCWEHCEYFASNEPISEQHASELAEQTAFALDLDGADYTYGYEHSIWQASNGTYYLAIEYKISYAIYPD